MSKSSVLYGVLATTLLVPTVLSSAIRASAVTNDQATQATAVAPSKHALGNTQNESNGLTESQIQKIDPYVTVSNNQYHLSNKAFSVLSQQELKETQAAISEANTSVSQQDLVIDQASKSTSAMNRTKAAYNSHYTSANFWWGTRYYFTSNAAVAQMQNELGNWTAALGITGAIGGALSAGAAAVVAEGGAVYMNKMSSDLGYYNATHIHNQIYMDVNSAGFYSMHVLA